MAREKDQREIAIISDLPKAEVLIIGGGINGIATFRDLALQGVDVVLVEREDYSSGASAASSHMVHGGVRYLENGEFRLVKESLQERNRLLRAAPHCVKPLKTTIPIFSVFSGLLSAPMRFLTHSQGKPKERGAFLIKVGLVLYDTFGRNGGMMPRHTVWGKKKTLQNFPDMNPDVKFSATYFDASMESPERLSLEVLSDALELENARAINYCEAVGVDGNQVMLRDRVSGKEFGFSADVVINATGPWTDVTNEILGFETSYMGGTKGSHIVVANPELLKACDSREIFFENNDGRIVLMYPLMDRVLIGTTDIRVDIKENIEVTEEEVDYFFDLVKLVFPKIEVNRSQITYRYSGVRPLPAADDLTPGFVSRDYRIELTRNGGPGYFDLLSLVGGKWTTFRALGEHLSNEALTLLGKSRQVWTANLPIGGGANFPVNESKQISWLTENAAGIDQSRGLQLLNRYGTRATGLLNQIKEVGEVSLTHDRNHSDLEIAYLVRTESVVHLADIFYRRTTIGFTGGFSPELVAEIAAIMATELGWDENRRKQEMASIKVESAMAS